MATLFEVVSVVGIVVVLATLAFIIAATRDEPPRPECLMGEDICPIHGGSRA